ncbi:PAAR domain-containing protein [Burkholderia sp. BCC1638]|uniref:PAAR domain-containing protein n=1 Tax=unclassified Burkholderia TaxID=2613784 RepID=UPI003263E98A
MKIAQSRNMVCLGDGTDRGGTIIEATGKLKHLGIGVALDGHGVTCPARNAAGFFRCWQAVRARAPAALSGIVETKLPAVPRSSVHEGPGSKSCRS